MSQAALIFAGVVAFHAAANAGDPSFKFEFTKPKDSAVAEKQKDRTVIVVTSESGIGQATITVAEGQWPEKVVLRLQYGKDKGFTNLEDIRLWTDRIRVEGNLRSSGKMRFCFLDEKGKPGTIQPGIAEPAGSIDVTVAERDGALEVTLPANLLRGADKLTVDWIDAYRR